MARTAPVPDIPPIPGMCPSIAVLAGGGDGGGGGGDGAGSGDGSQGAGAGAGGEGAGGDGRGAPDYQKHPTCGYESHPVDVVTGRAFTQPALDLRLSGPMPLRFTRMYSSTMASRDMGLGFGWAHTWGAFIEVHRRHVTVWNEQGAAVDMPLPAVGAEVIGRWGHLLRRDGQGFMLDVDDGIFRYFTQDPLNEARFILAKLEDRSRNAITITRAEGRITEVADSAGRTVRVRSREARIAGIEVVDPQGGGAVVLATYEHDDRGDLVSFMDADGFTARYTYDGDHRMTSDTDRTGLTFHFLYDAAGRCVESWGNYGERPDPSLADDLPKYLADERTLAKGVHHCVFDYHKDGYTEVTDATQVKRFFGNRFGTLDKAVNGRAVSTYTYDDDGHQLSRTDPLGATTSYERDARGRILRVTDPLGRTQSIERDSNGLPISVTDASGATVTATRDRFGRPTAVTDPLGQTTTYAYDDRGLVTRITAPDGGSTKVEYDAQGNPTVITLPNGGEYRSTFNGLGRRTSETDPLGGTRRFSYSTRGDLLSEHDPLGGVTAYRYDGEQHLLQHIQPSGATTTMTWGGYNKLAYVQNPLGHAVRAAYNRAGDLVAVYNEAGEAHRFTRDVAGYVVGEDTFDGRSIRTKYDVAGRPMVITTGEGDKTLLEYDAAGALVKRTYHDDTSEVFSYDACGRLIAVERGDVAVTYEYDAAGQIVRETQRVGEETHTIAIRRDVMGRRIGTTTSLGLDETIERDLLGAPKRIAIGRDCSIAIRTDLLGREVARELPGGGLIESAFDPLGRLSRRRVRSHITSAQRPGEPAMLNAIDNVTVDRGYRYDVVGNLIELWDRERGSTRFEYDPLGHVLGSLTERGDKGEAYRYDVAGNASEVASPRAYGPGGRLLRKGDTEYRWDGEGRLIEKRIKREVVKGPGKTQLDEHVWKYTWGADGLLRSVLTPQGTLVESTYDAFARRVEKRASKLGAGGAKVPVATTRFVWDGDVLVHEIRSIARRVGDPIVEERTYRFEEGGYQPTMHRERRKVGAEVMEWGWSHYVNEANGAPARLVDDKGHLVAALDRSIWGVTTSDPRSRTVTMVRFQGQYEDAETGLVYNRYRYYDPDTGRYVSPDPLMLRAGVNHYAYRYNPLGWIDPLGLINIPTLAVPTSGNVGAQMNKEAVGHLVAARQNGASVAEMGDMYEGMAGQIKAASGGTWGATRMDCTDGSVTFKGDGGGRELAITPDKKIHVGPPGIINMNPAQMSFSGGKFLVGPPNVNPGPEGTRVI